MFLEILVFVFTIIAYYQKERKSFLILNASIIFFLICLFYQKEAYNGVVIESMMFVIHIITLFTNEKIEKKLKILVPPLSFLVVIFAYDGVGLSLVLAVAITFFVLGVLQSNMIKNKIMFILGVLFLMIYNLDLQLYIVSLSNIIGVGVLVYSLTQLLKEKEK